jgi:hypothetical protein
LDETRPAIVPLDRISMLQTELPLQCLAHRAVFGFKIKVQDQLDSQGLRRLLSIYPRVTRPK